jgi:transcriptional regulator with XRE-family HTH domain
MKLKDYLYHNRISIQDFADRLEYSRTHLSQIVNGQSFPSKRLAKAIEQATAGKVKAEDLLKEKN